MSTKFNRPRIEDVLTQRFFIRPSFDIYGPVGGLYDLGPPGSALQANLLEEWRRFFVVEDQILELDTSIMTKEDVFRTSGHIERFTDFLVRDVVTHESLRADHLLEEFLTNYLAKAKVSDETRAEIEDVIKRVDDYSGEELGAVMKKYNVKSPAGNDITDPAPFNLMFSSNIGPQGNVKGYLRPETAQGMFVNFKYLYEYNNCRMPFAASQIGRAFRNEISPRSGLLRVREFTMAEIEHFVHPDRKDHPKFVTVKDMVVPLYPAPPRDNPDQPREMVHMTLGDAVSQGIINNETLGYFLGRIFLFAKRIGLLPEHLRFRQHGLNEMAHYAADCWDLEVETSYGWVECVGCADRSCYDLSRHEEVTRKGLVAVERLEEPYFEVQRNLKLNTGAIAKTFRQLTNTVKNHFQGMGQAELEALQEQIKAIGSGNLSFTIDGQTHEIDVSYLTITETTKKVEVREFVPGVIEPSFGIGRLLYCILEHTFTLREEDTARSYFRFSPRLAPVKAVLAPLSNNAAFTPLIEKLSADLRKHTIMYRIDDSSSSIGRRYARLDEIGVPFALTVDFESVKNETCTLRFRDDPRSQVRMPMAEAGALVADLVAGTTTWEAVLAKYPLHTAQDV
ncbi:glycyl-tRNA synthetase [Fonticula alba]|uniref:glycine--tRNA ligase n=1 Tax=Fonticula alba TaxID=691883 RepID=A0A058Z6Q4_FONAL|nr:glycyl-tRNA synthetase [Fonticula alba]KCV69949.1 glycyl-tRNA synthetase [Fonticula alba]|eukprot:XP_009495555.1 glycyl-tRNA synthetase [Fonticula alba]